jgi:transcriptional regulator with XRE-family HTH domain
MKALAAYIKELRRAQGMSQENLAHAIGLSSRQYIRFETGQNTIKAETLVRVISVLQAPLDHIIYILEKPSITPEDAQQLAEEWQRGYSSSPLPPEIEVVAHNLAGDPIRMGRWIGYGERLLEESGEQAK